MFEDFNPLSDTGITHPTYYLPNFTNFQVFPGVPFLKVFKTLKAGVHGFESFRLFLDVQGLECSGLSSIQKIFNVGACCGTNVDN